MTSPRPRRVTHDIADPAFPHGQDRGYHRGCRQQCCRVAHRARSIANELGKNPLQPAAPVREHLLSLLAAARSYTVLQDVTGLSTRALGKIGSGESSKIRADTARRILRVRHEEAHALSAVAVRPNGARMVPKGPYVDMLRRLQANGHTLGDLTRAMGSVASVPKWMNYDQPDITVEVAATVRALYQRLENIPGTSSRARLLARGLGYYPPACYDEDGTLDVRAIPDHPWARLDDRCARRMLVAIALLAEPTAGRARVAEAAGVSERQVCRIAKEMDLPADATREQHDVARARYAATLNAWQYDGLDTVHAAFRSGLVTSLGCQGAVNASVIQQQAEHPGYLAWQAEVAQRAQIAADYARAA